MKAKQRHELKQNEFAEAAVRIAGAVAEHRSRAMGFIAAAAVVIIAFGGYTYYRSSQADKAGALLGVAMDTADATIAPPSTLPGAAQAAGTFPTANARSQAALKLFQDVAAQYPSSEAGIAASYQAAGELLALGRFNEAEASYTRLVESNSPVYAAPARLGLAQVKIAAGKYDEAMKMLTDLSGDRDGAVPVDGVLMQLADASSKAGKAEDARAAYKRVVDEFADSAYAATARQKLAALN